MMCRTGFASGHDEYQRKEQSNYIPGLAPEDQAPNEYRWQHRDGCNWSVKIGEVIPGHTELMESLFCDETVESSLPRIHEQTAGCPDEVIYLHCAQNEITNIQQSKQNPHDSGKPQPKTSQVRQSGWCCPPNHHSFSIGICVARFAWRTVPPNGKFAKMRVSLGCDSTVSLPSNSSARSRIERSPTPARRSCGKPIPSSTISI